MNETRKMLDLAARLAFRGFGMVEPNPCVGAVIVRDGVVIGMGHHRIYGGMHAEPAAIADARRRFGENSTCGATMYVTLEPCSHQGKQPPCVDAVMEAGIGRVVCARRDPNPMALGGAERLQAAGIACEFADERDSVNARRVSDAFIKRVTTGLPWVIAKWAQTIDGRVGTRTGESQWISNERSRRYVHRLRASVDAVVTAIGTVLADDPVLTARGGWHRRRIARRVLIDPGLEIPEGARMAHTIDEAPLTIICSDEALGQQQRKAAVLTGLGAEIHAIGSEDEVSVDGVLRHLAATHEANNVLIEAGPGLLGRLFDGGLVDEAHVYVAPKLLGDDLAKPAVRGRVAERLAEAKHFDLTRVRRFEDDVLMVYRRRDVHHRDHREQ